MVQGVASVRIVVAVAVWQCARLATAAEAPPAPYQLRSTASAEVAARVDAHLETQFARYRTLLPPRVKPAATPTIELFGLLDEYRSALARRNLSIANPACYVADGQVVLLGFDGARYDAELKLLRDQADRLRKQDRELNADLNDRLKAEELRFVNQGNSPAEARRLTQDRRRKAQQGSAELRSSLATTERALKSGLAAATARMLEAASHEAFHAYVAAYVYPPASGGLPRWLDEGLAQAVEHGTWPANRLQTARAPGELLRRIAAARAARGDDRRLFDLGAVLDAESSKFVLPGSTSAGDDAAQDAADTYLAAWSLTQYLLATGRLSAGEKLDRYVADGATAPAVRFERWQGRPIAEIQRDWRNYYQSGGVAR